MKIQKVLHSLVVFVSLSSVAFAHCPSAYTETAALKKTIKLCFMLDQNLVYIYDSKVEHDGPYSDFHKAVISKVKDETGAPLEFTKVARGIYKINSATIVKKIAIEITSDTVKKTVSLKHE